MWAKFVEFSTFPNCLLLCNSQNLWTSENSGGESTDNGPPASVFRTVLGAQEECETWQGITKVILLMEEILHQLLDTVVYPIIYSVWYIPGGAGFLPSTVCASKYTLMIQKSYAFWVPEMEMLCFTSSVCGFKLSWYRTEIGWLDSWTISGMI